MNDSDDGGMHALPPQTSRSFTEPQAFDGLAVGGPLASGTSPAAAAPTLGAPRRPFIDPVEGRRKPRARGAAPSQRRRSDEDLTARSREPQEPKLRCLLTTLKPSRGLSRALVEHLAVELPRIQFRLRVPDGGAGPDALWVCGYTQGHAALVQRLRLEHPEATLIVTGRAPLEQWESEVLGAGADSACTWPLPVARLGELLAG